MAFSVVRNPQPPYRTTSARRSWPTPASAATSPTTWSASTGPRTAAGATARCVPYGPLAARPGDDGAALRPGDLRGAQGLPPARRLDRHVPARRQRGRASSARRAAWPWPSCRTELFLESLRALRRGRPGLGARPTPDAVAVPAAVHDRHRGRARRAAVEQLHLPADRLAGRRVLHRRRAAGVGVAVDRVHAGGARAAPARPSAAATTPRR